MKYGYIIHPPHAMWIRKCCNLHLWPTVRQMTKDLIAKGDACQDALQILDLGISGFMNELKLAEDGDEGAVLVAPPKGMTVAELQARIDFAITEWKYEQE